MGKLKIRKNVKYQPRAAAGKVGNFGFLMSIPGLLILSGSSCALLIISLSQTSSPVNQWFLLLGGLLASVVLSLTFAVERLRTLLHELKHGVVVVLSGNSVKGMTIGKGSGHIDYTLRYDKLHFAPVICLAPYFLPLLSAPILAAAIFFENQHLDLFLFLLGLGLGFDTSTAFYDLHPNQSDLKRVFGGFAIASIFIASFHIFWISTCLTWANAKSQGYLHAGKILYQTIVKLIQ